MSVLGNKPVDLDKHIFLNLQLQRIRESALQHGRSFIGWHTDLLPAHHSQTKPGESCPCFRRQSMEAPTAALALRLDCIVRTSRRPDWANFRFWKRCFFVSLVLNSVHNTIVTCNLNFPSLLIHRDPFNDLLVHLREAVGRLPRNSPLHKLLCVSQKVVCLTCALICDWRLHPISNHAWLQMPALLDFSISFVVNDTAELEVDPAPAPSLCLRKQCGCGWAVYRLA